MKEKEKKKEKREREEKEKKFYRLMPHKIVFILKTDFKSLKIIKNKMESSSSSSSSYPPRLQRCSWKFAHLVPRSRVELENMAQKIPETHQEQRRQKLFEYVEDIYTHFLRRIETGNGKTLEYMFSAFADISYLPDVEAELKKLFPDCDIKLYPQTFELDDDTEKQIRFFIRISL